MVENPFEIWGTYTSGLGKAHEAIEETRRAGNMSGCLGAKMTGTFNVSVTRSRFAKMLKDCTGRRGYWYRYLNIVPVTYYLCRVIHSSGESRMAWIINWRPLPPELAKVKKYAMELLSRRPIPDTFKDGSTLKVFVCSPWDKDQIAAWWPKATRKWFQSFSWGPQRSDGLLVWNAIYKHFPWSDTTVLDVGCNSGWYAFQAAKYGAHVYGYDKSEKFVEIAKTIAGHIEHTDVDFGLTDPGTDFDVIFYFSVHHYVDPDYSRLKETVDGYKKRCKKLFIELIDPAPGYNTPRDAIYGPVGGTHLLTYKHNVRCNRSVWAVDGDLK
jgi:hypothetical protein